MRVNKKQKGITIAETMIVLGVTSFMLSATIMMISGQIERYRFKTTVITAEQIIRDTLNDVADGYFGELAEPQYCDPGELTKIGDSGDCVYVGKYIKIDEDKPSIVSKSRYKIETGPGHESLHDSNTIESTLPGYVDYSFLGGGTGDFQILFVGPAGTDVGGGVIPKYTDNPSSGAPAAFAGLIKVSRICLKSGNRSAVITIGDTNGSVITKTEYTPCT